MRTDPRVVLPAIVAVLLGVLVGCARPPVGFPPDQLVVKAWHNRGPADPYPDPKETTVAGLPAGPFAELITSAIVVQL